MKQYAYEQGFAKVLKPQEVYFSFIYNCIYLFLLLADKYNILSLEIYQSINVLL